MSSSNFTGVEASWTATKRGGVSQSRKLLRQPQSWGFRFSLIKNSQRSTRAPLSQQQRWTMGLSTKWPSFACMNVPADIRKRNLVAFCTSAQHNDILLYQIGEFTTSSLELPCRDMCDMHLDLYSGDLSCAFKSIWYYYDYDLSITYDYILFLQGLVGYLRVGINESRCKFWMYCEVYACLMWFEVHVFSMYSYEKNP